MYDLARIAASGLVARIDYHQSLGSTSDRALTFGAEGVAELPLLVLAEEQTFGRGRGANRWFAAPGALTFSLVLEAPTTSLPPQRWPQVSLAAGVAVADALQNLAPTASLRLKWPNDVFLSGRKACGILCESAPGWRDRLVVGIGVNVNNQRQQTEGNDQSAEASQPIALVEHDGLPRDLTSVLIDILDQFDRRWTQLLDDQFAHIATDYRERCLLTGKAVTIGQPAGPELVGVCLGINNAGGLRIRTEHREEALVSGTVLGWETTGL